MPNMRGSNETMYSNLLFTFVGHRVNARIVELVTKINAVYMQKPRHRTQTKS